jgi:hypothetical protein
VLEHVEHPVTTVLELQRVARRAVILTTEELHHDRAHIDEYLFRRPGWPHMERNLFHPDDLALCFPGASLTPQCDQQPPQDLDAPATRAWLLANTRTTELRPGRTGVVAVELRDPQARRPRATDDPGLLDRLLASTIDPGARAPSKPPDRWLHGLLRDPLGHLPLRADAGALLAADGRRYLLVDGVPDMVPDVPDPTREDLARRVAPLPPDRAAGLLALQDRLYLPERWTQDAFDFRIRDHRRGFWPNDQLRLRPGADGFQWFSTGADPWVLSPCLQRPLREVEITLRVHNPALKVAAGHGQLFWKGPGDQTVGEDRSVKFVVPNDGLVHRHRVVLAGHPRLPEVVQWLRIDPIDGPCEVDLLGLRLG